jgi:hypothetical protein
MPRMQFCAKRDLSRDKNCGKQDVLLHHVHVYAIQPLNRADGEVVLSLK